MNTTQGGGHSFPTTTWSGIANRNDPRGREALGRLCERYWRPIFMYIMHSWGRSREEAKDLTQEFFVKILEGDVLERYSKDRGRFRTFLKGVLNHFMADVRRAGGRIKRGGGKARVSLDVEDLGTPDNRLTPEQAFDREWARGLLAEALELTRQELLRAGKQVHVGLLERCVINPPSEGAPSYKELAQEYGISESDVRNYLALARRMIRAALIRLIAEGVTSEDDIYEELHEILSHDLGE